MNRILALLLTLVLAFPVLGGEIWVSPSGNDLNSGTKESPLQSLSIALRHARELRRLNDLSIKNGIFIIMQDGVYPQPETLLIRPEDSGTADSPTVIRAAEGAYPVLSGGMTVTGWRKLNGAVPGLPKSVKGRVWVADVPMIGNRPLEFRQMWVNGSKAIRARQSEPDVMPRILSFDPVKREIWIPTPEMTLPTEPKQMEMLLHQRWAVAFLRVKSAEVQGDRTRLTFHDPESRLEFEHPWPQPITDGERNSPFILNNAIEFMDAPGEWYCDTHAGRIYYIPREGEDMTSTEVVVPVLETLVEFTGTLSRPVSHVRFEGIGFEHSSWMRPSYYGHVPLQTGMYLLDAYKLQVPGLPDKAALENQAWIGRPASAVVLNGANHTAFVKCKFRRLASTGLDYVRGTHHALVEGCLFTDIGGTALMAGAFPDKGYETHVPFRPDTQGELCTDMRIANNLVTDVTNEDWGAVGIAVGYASNVVIEHNEVTDVNYSGISLGWGWYSRPNCAFNNRIYANRVHRFAKQMYDVGGIYTLSAQPGTVIENNAVYDIVKTPYAANDRAFYIYFDEGTAFVDVINNWCPEERFDSNTPGSGNLWKNNGPSVSDSIRDAAGLEPEYRYLLNAK